MVVVLTNNKIPRKMFNIRLSTKNLYFKLLKPILKNKIVPIVQFSSMIIRNESSLHQNTLKHQVKRLKVIKTITHVKL